MTVSCWHARGKRAICDAAVIETHIPAQEMLSDQDLRRWQIACGLCVTSHHPQQGYCQVKRFVVDSHLNIEGIFYQEFVRGLFQQIRAE